MIFLYFEFVQITFKSEIYFFLNLFKCSFQIMASWKESILGELSYLSANLVGKQVKIEKAIDELESDKVARDDERKKILLSLIKNTLRILSEEDKKISRDLKVEALDAVMKMSKLKEEICDQTSQVKAMVGQDEEDSKVEVIKQFNKLKSCVSELGGETKLEVVQSPNMPDMSSYLSQGSWTFITMRS